MPGTVTVKPIQAKLEKKEGIFQTFDPYCVAIIGNQHVESEVCIKGGKNPAWEKPLTIERKTEPYCYVEVKDKSLLKDQVLGICAIDLDELSAARGSQKWYELYYDKKPVGEILVEASITSQGFPSHSMTSGGSTVTGGEELRTQEAIAEGTSNKTQI